jgi:hypothetical protein
MKFNALLKDLLQNGVLGTAVADIHVVEWQKRGLPHGHILIILRSQDQPRDMYINSLRPCVCPSDAMVLCFNSPAESACIFYGRTGSSGELKCRGRFSSPTLLLLLLRRLSVTIGRREK